MKVHRIHVLFPFVEGPHGGGNQFLKALRQYLRDHDLWAETPVGASIVLFNSHHSLEDIIRARVANTQAAFVHRLDGPISLITQRRDVRETLAHLANRTLADGTIFQTAWSRQKNLELGLPRPVLETVIFNAPNPDIFNRQGKFPRQSGLPTKLIATSWSANRNKGFETYAWLDQHLDSSRYQMSFVGNSPVTFRRIRQLGPQGSRELALEIKRHDIYLAASRNDPCSNALIEALHCGLPALAYNDGGHPELVGNGGLLFDNPQEIPPALHTLVENYDTFRASIALPQSTEVMSRYVDFCTTVFDHVVSARCGNVRRSWTTEQGLLARIRFLKLLSWLRTKLSKARPKWGNL